MKALSLMALVISCIFFIPQPFWWLELLTHFVVPLWIGALLLLVWHSFKKQKTALLLSFIALLLTSLQLIPFTPIKPKLSLVNFTVYNANVLTSNLSHDLILKQILLQSPDVITLQEFSTVLQQSLMPLDFLYPYQVLVPRNDNFGIALYSKWPITEQNILKFEPLKLPTIDVLIQTAPPVRIITTHPIPPMNKTMFNARNQHMLELAQHIQLQTSLVILTGDFNNTSFTNSFKGFLKQSQLTQTRKYHGIKGTWPSAFNNIGLSIPIDHILLSPQINQFELNVLPTIGSDHLPLFLKAYLP
ncbi:MAG: endonuclease/exonuclease/phosphatase family protein [Saccharospirillaceae bacterium]|nr:endonuclease/exonuclease/phosphatase family protein [Pseudomonadales bacterium]NRB80024.1 endonuclease/exonuclease/phosphatase family protein [Saccharospirillaceae bacterium]